MKVALRAVLRVAMILTVDVGILLCLPLVAASRLLYGRLGTRRISFWTGTPILTLAQMAASERLLGERVICIVRGTYWISQDFDVILSDRCAANPWLLYPLTGAAFLVMLTTAARVHTFADGGLLPSMRKWRFALPELVGYRLFRIPHLVWTYGADVRTRGRTLELGEPNCCTDCTQVGKACVCDDKLGKRLQDRLRENGARIFAMGDMIEYTPGSRNDLFFWPLDLEGRHRRRAPEVEAAHKPPGVLRVVHAPNHRQFKGTRYLEEAVTLLQKSGVLIELVLVERVPNDEALKLYRSADVIFDQCMIGFHGYFALEAMALGKPVMCFIRKPLDYLIEPAQCPIIQTTRETLREDLRRLAQEPGALTEIGLRGRKYVERNFSRRAFAQRLRSAYEDLGIVK